MEKISIRVEYNGKQYESFQEENDLEIYKAMYR